MGPLDWDVKEEEGKASTRRSGKSVLENDASESDGDASDEYQDNEVPTDPEEMDSECDDQAFLFFVPPQRNGNAIAA